MNIKDFKDSLPYLLEAQLTAFIWGHAGIGKTSIVKQYAKARGYKFFAMYLGTQSDIGDILGLADFVRDENGTAVATTFATPNWLRETINYCNENPDSGAIIFLDEFNRARRDILSGMFSLALDKTFHTITLPKNCHIIAAGNPPTDEYFVTDINETALMSRFVHIKLEPSTEEWITYGKEKGIDHTLISFIKQQPELLEDHRSSFELPVKVDRRAYERLDALFKLKTPVNLLTQLMYGIIGIERTIAYQTHLTQVDAPFSAEELFSMDKSTLDKLTSWSNPEDIKSSLISITCDNLYDHLVQSSKTNKELPKKSEDSLFTFLITIPKDMSHNIIKRLVEGRVFSFITFIGNEKYERELIKLLETAIVKRNK